MGGWWVGSGCGGGCGGWIVAVDVWDCPVDVLSCWDRPADVLKDDSRATTVLLQSPSSPSPFPPCSPSQRPCDTMFWIFIAGHEKII